MGCCGKRCARRSETDVQRTQRVLKNTLVMLAVMNLAHVLLGLAGMIFALVWGVLFIVALRASQRKSERGLRLYVTLALCILCCGLVLVMIALVGVGYSHGDDHMVQQPDSNPMPVEQPESSTPLLALRNPESSNVENPESSSGMNSTEDFGPDEPGVGRSDFPAVAVLFAFSLFEMVFLSLKIASLMLAARLVRFLRVERLSASAMMVPYAKHPGDIALEPMASTGAPQVFYVPTSDGQPQYIVYSPVPGA